MNIPIDKDKKIAIFGYGVEGRATYNFLKDQGYKNLAVFDEKAEDEHIENDLNKMLNHDVIFRSPGIHKDHPKLIEAGEKGIQITSSTGLFFDICPCPIIGITGTKGKGTTSTLIYEILKEAGKDAYLGGNIGIPALNLFKDLWRESVVVLELSSFQLQDLEKSPHVAVILNTTSDHLDYHKDVNEYLEAKEPIVKFQTSKDFAVFNLDYKYYERYEKLTAGEKYYISAKKKVQKGAFVSHDEIFIEDEMICRTDEVGLIGPHNIENILPAIMVAQIMRIPKNIIKKAIIEFKGLPHRLELIREFEGIKYYNDSFSTTPETCIAAIRSFENPLILIAGGSEKNSDFDELGKVIAETENLKKVILMGDTARRIKDSIDKHGGADSVIVANYKDAFELAHEDAWKGYTVLMSPASASFDQFKNYKERGDKFRNWVESL